MQGMCGMKRAKAVWNWAWEQTLGREDGRVAVLPLGVAPPKAALCTVLFNPVYKMIFIKNTKVAGTSVFVKFGQMCPEDITLEKAAVCHSYMPVQHLLLPCAGFAACARQHTSLPVMSPCLASCAACCMRAGARAMLLAQR